MRKLIFILALVALLCMAAVTITDVTRTEGTVLHSIQSSWEIAESELSGDTQTPALSTIERTKLTVDAAIAAGDANDQISTYTLPSKWNAIRLRCIGITADSGAITHQIYFGSLGSSADCELTYAGQLAWTMGAQVSIYDQIAFTSGGPYIPQTGDGVTGNTSAETAVVVELSALSGGTWADANAAGTITYKSASGAFTSGETVSIKDRLNRSRSGDALTHTTSDLVDFELADTLTATAKSWGSSWTSTSPADDTNAEAEIDIKGADYMVIVTTAANCDAKLLIKGY